MTDWASLSRLDAVAQADLCARGEVSADEAIAAARARIDALNPLLRAVVTHAEPPSPPAAPSRAPLYGVPFLMKDASPWPNLRWAIGSRLFASNVAPMTTPFAARLLEAGLVCMGKSATSEFGLLGSTETLLEGVAHNPWDLAVSATGSSGGSAAAVAAGLVPIAHASDGGGSIRVPASACGLFGFMPSRGRVVPAAVGSSDFGDITGELCVSRSVRDSALFFSVVEDRTASGGPVGWVREPLARKLRIATWTRTIMGEEPTPGVRRAYDEAVALCRELGHVVETVPAPAYDGAAFADAFFLIAGAAIAGVVDMMDKMRGEPVQEHELEPFTWALVEVFRERGSAAVARAKNAFTAATRVYRDATRDWDVVLTPTLATEVWPLGHLSPILSRETLIARTARSVGYTPVHNVAGCPAMSVPLHFPERGAPIGTHFAATPGADALLLGLAYQLEAARPWRDRWPPYSIPALFA